MGREFDPFALFESAAPTETTSVEHYSFVCYLGELRPGDSIRNTLLPVRVYDYNLFQIKRQNSSSWYNVYKIVFLVWYLKLTARNRTTSITVGRIHNFEIISKLSKSTQTTRNWNRFFQNTIPIATIIMKISTLIVVMSEITYPNTL